MDRAQDHQFVAEHACSWRSVTSTWLALAIVAGGISLAAWSPLRACDAQASEAHQVVAQVSEAEPRLQHRDDDPDEFFDPSAP